MAFIKWILLVYFVRSIRYVIYAKQVQIDYCSWETFNPKCEENEVITMKTALYGLIKEGRCVLEDLGFIGCSSDQLGFLDAKCSGQNTCEVIISSKELKDKIQSCPEPYLEATYHCQKVLPMSQNCQGMKKIDAKPVPYYMASLTSLTTGCGFGDSPFVIQAHPGQGINLTLIDFAWSGRPAWHRENNRCDHVYGHVINVDNNVIDICGTSQREKILVSSSQNQVQLVLQEEALRQFKFLIKFQAVGCAEVVPPKNSWLTKDGNDMTIGCQTSSDTWQLKCIGNHWIGVIGNCTQRMPIEKPMEQTYTFSGHHVFAVAIGCLALIACCVTITVGIYFVKRYKVKLKSQHVNDNDICLLPKERWTASGISTHPRSCQGETLTQPFAQTLLLDRTSTRQPTILTSGLQTTNHESNLQNTNNTIMGQGFHNLNQSDGESVKYFVLEKPEYMNSEGLS